MYRAYYLWPDTSHLNGANSAARSGFWAACFVAAAMFGFAFYSEFVRPLQIFDIWGLIDSFLFAAIAIGIWKSSRIAALLGLVLYLAEQWYLWRVDGLGNIVVALLLTLMFVNSVRGTFAIHRIRMRSEQLQDEA